MALNGYLRLEGEKQKQVKGSVTQKGREDSIMVIAISHEIVAPRDPASGLPSGKRMHKPFIITKELDISSPKLFYMLCNNENILKWTLELWRPSPSGMEEQHYTIAMEHANIASIQTKLLNNKNPELMKYAMYEEIAFTYQRIIWTWKAGSNVEHDDNWNAPNA